MPRMQKVDTANERVTRAIGFALSDATDDTWRLDEDYLSPHFTQLNGPDGQALLLDFKYSGKRIEIKGVYPSGASRVPEAKIGVGRFRHPDAIAREITRRLLPTYVEGMAAARVEIAESERHETQRRALEQEVLRLTVGAQRSPWGHINFYNSDVVSGHIRVFGPESGSLEIRSANGEVLRALAEVIGRYVK